MISRRPRHRVPALRLLPAAALAAALASCGTTTAHPGSGPGSSAAAPATSSAPSGRHSTPATPRPPTLAPGPGGLTPVFSHGPREAAHKTVALTFDADMTADEGPRAAAGERFDNPALIGTLRALEVPATVFMTGRWAEEYPDEARALGRDPLFEVANHSYSHYSFTGDCYGLPTLDGDTDRMRTDVERAFTAIRAAGVPHPMPYFRFPGGCHDRRSLRAVGALGVTAVQWDVVGGDAFATDADAVARQVLDGVRPGSVVVLHCTRSAAPATERAVRKIVPELRERGYRFVRVSELIGASAGRH
ncbi:polysaccharide deacetylase family protein [Streptomyces griseoaurantiacus]|uniref:polysaccharide deacetylase family protein n=1 Tax=Streptomyces griseoaurantiacus TaxID=68213 RepID=UPI002E3376DB|nr:polysaccharide deacetylase family protein [Streptomyces jietaisiensis]